MSATSTIPVAVITAAQIDADISRRLILSSLQPAMLGYHQRCGTQARSDVGRDRVGAELRVEAVLLTMLVFLGVNVAWLLLFDEAQSPSALEDPTRPHALRHACIAAVPLSSLLQLDLTALLLELRPSLVVPGVLRNWRLASAHGCDTCR